MKKIIIGVLIGFVVLVVAVPFLIPTKMISQKIASLVEENLHKKTTIQSVRISIFPRLGLRVSGLEIGTLKQDDYYVSLEKLFVELQWRPLLKKQVSVSELSVTKPVIELYTVKKDAPPAPKNPPSDESGNAQFHIDSLSIDDCSFTMFDAKMKPTVHVGGLSEKLSFDHSSSGTSTIDGTTIIPVLSLMTPMGELGRNTRIEIRKKLQVDPDNLKIEELKISLGSLPIAFEGNVAHYSSDTPDVDIKFSGGPSDIENIIGLIPSNMLSSDLKEVESKGNLVVQGRLKGKINTAKAAESIQSSDFSVSMTLSNGFVKHPSLEKPMSNIGISLQVDPKTVQLKNFHAEFGQSVVQYSAVITNYLTHPTFTFDTDTRLNLKDVYALHQDMPVKDLKGQVNLALKASGSTEDLAATQINGTVQAQEIGLQYPEFKYNVEHINSVIKLEKNSVLLQSLAMLINGSDISAHGRVDNPMAMMDDNKNSLLKFSVTAASKNLDADKLMPPPSDEKTTLPESFFKLDGDIAATIQSLTFNKLAMTQAVGNIGVHRGLISFNPISVHTFGGTVALTGDVNLVNRNKPTFDLDTELRNIAVDKALAYADNINKLLKLDHSLKADIGLKAKSKGELTKDFSLNMATLNSVGSFSLSNAVIQNHPIQKAFSSYFKSDRFQKISIKQWTQAFSVEQGKLNVNNLNFAAQDFEFNINGWQSLDGKNDFAIDAKLPPALAAKITDKLPAPVAALIGNQKQITLPFSVTGETTSPSLGLNSEKLTSGVKDQLTSQLKTESGKLTKDLTNDAKGDLKNLVKPSGKKTGPKKDAVKKDVKDIKNKLKKIF